MSIKDGIFCEKNFEATRRPILDATPPPAYCYASETWYRREVDEIFRKEWLMAGRVEQLPKLGDYLTLQIGTEPVVVVRDRSDELHAFLAVCRHRGALLVEGSGNCRTFQCPYHQWTYALNGSLLSTPGRPRPMDDVRGFDFGAHSLIPLQLEIWEGSIFVNFDMSAPSLTQWLGRLPQLVADYKVGDMVATRVTTEDVDCNWKVLVENGLDHYHQDIVHIKHLNPNDTSIWTMEDCLGPAIVTYGLGSLTIKSAKHFEMIKDLTDKEQKGVYWLWIQPNIALNLTPYFVMFRTHLPLGVEKTRVVTYFCFPKHSVHDGDPGLRDPSFYSGRDAVWKEDVDIAAKIQPGLRSELSRMGRYSPREEGAHGIANYFVERVIGPQSGDRGVTTSR